MEVHRLEAMTGRQRRLRTKLDRPILQMHGTRARRRHGAVPFDHAGQGEDLREKTSPELRFRSFAELSLRTLGGNSGP
ncbi:hypothetical protein ASF79_07390 [Agreia sp. Leaf335]|nr:hypothetical protein ASF79_07390 [Agreia sp. Leaf335]